jgi:drug/metabolite transporter (DMT)-like permease
VSRRDAGLLILLGAGWGAVYPLTAVVLRELSTPAVVIGRTALSAMVLIPVAARSGAWTAVRNRPIAVLVAALLQATIPLVLLTAGQRHVSAGLAGILVASQPIWATVLSAIADRSAHLRQFTGVLLGLCGVSLIFLRDLHLGSTSGWGGTALLLAAMLFAAGAVWIERVVSDVPPLTTATAAMTVSAFALAPFAAAAPLRMPDPPTAGWLLVLGVVTTGGMLVLFYTLIRRIGAIRANLASYLAPVFAVGYGMVFFGERASSEALVGLLLILGGSYITARR